MSLFEKKIKFSARGTPITLYSKSPIFDASQMLSAIIDRWNEDNIEHWLDIDPSSFHFLINFYTQCKESEVYPNKMNIKLSKLYAKQLISNPQYISGAQYLGIDLDLDQWFSCDYWDCQNSELSNLNVSVTNKEWHYIDCIVYLAYMIPEKFEMFKSINVTMKKGIEDFPKQTVLSCISITVTLPYQGKTAPGQLVSIEKDTLIFGVNTHGSYANQHSSISYKSLENIIQMMSVSSFTSNHPNLIITKFYAKIIELIPGYNNISLRKIL